MFKLGIIGAQIKLIFSVMGETILELSLNNEPQSSFYILRSHLSAAATIWPLHLTHTN